MGYRLNRLDEPVFMAGPKPMRTEFGIHLRLESCEVSTNSTGSKVSAVDKIMLAFNPVGVINFSHGIEGGAF